jgi:hypothetical protein
MKNNLQMASLHDELSQFLNQFSNAQKAKFFRLVGLKGVSAGYFNVRGGMPVILAYQYMRSQKINAGVFMNYFLLTNLK